MTPRKPRLRTRLRDAWRVLRQGLPEPEPAPVLPALVELSAPMVAVSRPLPLTPPSIGDCRVTRERDGRIIETLYQGTAAVAAQQYAYHNPTVPGEWIRFYRGNDACSGKPFEAT